MLRETPLNACSPPGCSVTHTQRTGLPCPRAGEQFINKAAADAPRWRVTDDLGVSCEEAMNPETLQTLTDMGHEIVVEKPDLAFGFGGAQLIHRLDSGGYAGGSDPRKDGGSYGL